jgi:tRNA dimethylallyltransferase
LKNTLIVIVGPTGSGKTELAEALAKQRPCRLLSADSQQVYRGMDIGTAKPMGAARAAWGLMDLVNPGQPFSAGDWVRGSVPLIEAAWSDGTVPVLAGGTGLYLKALLEGLADIPAVPDAVRQGLALELERKGLVEMAARLRSVDPALAGRTDLANPRRVLRGLEVQAATGKALSQWQATGTVPALKPARTLWLGLDPGKDSLEQRLETRTDALLAHGWLQEVELLSGLHGDDAIARSAAIGYPELLDQLRGRQRPAQAREAILKQTRQYARRQRTWFRSVKEIQWLSPAAALDRLAALEDGSKS